MLGRRALGRPARRGAAAGHALARSSGGGRLSFAAAPHVRLLDARTEGLTSAGLRALARSATAASGAPFVSRSYCPPFALVAWHTEPVGVDIERIRPCGASFAESICTPAERAELSGLPETELVALWCSKEALAKALGDAVRYDPRRLESPMRWPDGRAGSWRAAALAVAPGHTGWLCWQAGRRIPA